MTHLHTIYFSKKMEDLLVTGSVVKTWVTITGVERSERSKCVAALSTKPAPIPSFNATVMLTIDNGERKTRWAGLVCICDSNDEVLTLPLWRFRYSDKGYLDFRDHLPVRKVVVGDTNRTGSEAHFSVGPLRCHGDSEFMGILQISAHTLTLSFAEGLRVFIYLFIYFNVSTGNIWNTIAFTKPTYITFPTFRPGSSADISFHFKTYRDHGVFLENSDDQLRNFIRIELNSELTHKLAGSYSSHKTERLIEELLIIHFFQFYFLCLLSSSSHP